MRRKNHLFILLAVCFLLSNTYAFNSQSAEWELRITIDRAEVRMEPDMKSTVVNTVKKGSFLKSYEKVGEWFRVITADETGFVVIGYIHSSAVEIIREKSIQQPDYWKEEPKFFKGIGLSVKLTGGLNYFFGGDINEGSRGLYDLTADFISSSGFTVERRIKSFHQGYDFTGDIIFNISPKLGIGLGTGIIHATKQSLLIFSRADTGPHSLDSQPTISAVPIRLGLFLTLPIHRLFNVTFNGGAALYLTKYSYGMRTTWDGTDRIYHNASTNGLGFHGGIGFEINLMQRATLVIEGQGRFAKITNFKGKSKTRTPAPSPLGDIETVEEGMLYYLEGDEYPSLAVLEEEPSGYKTVRKAKFDFSGFVFRIGLRFKF